MLRIAAECGTTDIVATPHSNLDFTYDPVEVNKKLAEVLAAAGPIPRVHRGCDLHLSFDNIQKALEDPTRFTINGRGFLLVEFPDFTIFRTTGEIFDTLLGAGMVPIVTHPERNTELQQRITELAGWVEKGCLLQVTAQSLLGRFGERANKFSDKLLKRGLVHVVASDAHDCEDRTPDLSGANAYIARHFGAETAELLLVHNPGRILLGEPVSSMDVGAAASEKKWYRLWR
jgi:protein-tyrosine phosphatase